MPITTPRADRATPAANPVSGARSAPWLGSHLSISGGMHHALEAASTLEARRSGGDDDDDDDEERIF